MSQVSVSWIQQHEKYVHTITSCYGTAIKSGLLWVMVTRVTTKLILYQLGGYFMK